MTKKDPIDLLETLYHDTFGFLYYTSIPGKRNVFSVISLPHIFGHDGLKQDCEIEPDSIASAIIYLQGLRRIREKATYCKQKEMRAFGPKDRGK
jgi:hypothetical protein